MPGLAKILEGLGVAAAGAALDFIPGAQVIGGMLQGIGWGMVVGGIGQEIAGNAPVKGIATATKNSIAPWNVVYGRGRPKATLVYDHCWGANNIVRDMVFVAACNSCNPIDPVTYQPGIELLFDQQRIQIDTNAIPTSALAGYSIPAPATGAGTSFTPLQQKIFITGTISRSNDVVTVVCPQDIPYLTEGDPIIILDRNGESVLAGAGMTGTFQVAQIVSRVPSGGTNILTFTYLCGGIDQAITNHGEVQTKWLDFGRTVYFEPLFNPLLGQTFIGATAGVPWQGTGKLCTPASPQNAGSDSNNPSGPNPWTADCSLQGKTAVFLRVQYDSKYYQAGFPQVSFHIHGKNDIYDPRLGPCTGVKIAGCSNPGSGYQIGALYAAGDVLTLVQSGASGGQVTITGVNSSGAITSWQVTNPGTGYALGSATVTGGHGTGATFMVQALTGAAGCNVYTENAALCIADFLADQTWGYKCAYETDIPLAPLIVAANICDQTVALAAGGTEPMYALNGQFEVTEGRGKILQDMLTACAGRITPEAPFVIQPGYWTGATVSPTDLQAISAGPYHWKGPTIHEQYNGVKGTYISPANKWQSTDYPAYVQDTMHGYSGPAQYGGDINLAADNGERRWKELNLPFTISASTAQRLAKIELLRSRWANGNQGAHTGSGAFSLNMAGYVFAPLDIFEGTAAFLGISSQYLEVISARLTCADKGGSMLLGVGLDVRSTDSSIYVWNTEEELTPQGYVQSNVPSGQAQETQCWPWSPGYAAPLSGDAIGGPASFGIEPVYGTDAQGNQTVSLQIKGTPPINALDTGVAKPQISCTGSSTGGSLPSGTYVLGVAAYDSGSSSHADTDYLSLATVYVGGSGSGSISGAITWGSGDDGGDLYVALWTADGYVFHWQQTLAPGTATFSLTSFNQATPGGPDPLFDHMSVLWQQEIHAGVLAAQVQAVTATTITLASSPSDPCTGVYPQSIGANQFRGYTVSLLAKLAAGVEIPVLNMPIASNTSASGNPPEFVLTIGPTAGHQLPDLTTLLAVGDLLVIRGKYTFTTNSDGSQQFSDPNVANAYYPTGAAGVEAGHVAAVMSGADSGDIQTIAAVAQDSNGLFTIFKLAGKWTGTWNYATAQWISPSTGDIIAICAAALAPEVPGAALQVENGSVTAIVAQPNVQNLAGSTWLFRVRAEDVDGNHCDDLLCPTREVFIFGGQGTRTVTASTTQLRTDGLLRCDTTTGNITVQLLAFSVVGNQTLIVTKTSSDANTVTVTTAPGDTFPGGGTTVVLTDNSTANSVTQIKFPG